VTDVKESLITNKTFWKNTYVVDIPFEPFQKQNTTESRIIDYVANRMMQIARDEKRLEYSEGIFSSEKDRNFTQSESIVAIDSSGITEYEISYLNHFRFITRVHPCVIINCDIPVEDLKSSDLHPWLKKEKYILPVFARIPAADMISFHSRYGEPLFHLLSGNVASINVSDITGLDRKFTIDDLHNRIPGLSVENNKIYHRPEIIWLGIDSQEMSEGLSHLFNTNRNEFDVSEFCKEFSIDEATLSVYLKDCMLFSGSSKSNHAQFRLSKKLFFPKVMHAVMHQFEEKLIENHAIDATHGSYPGFSGDIIEYHSLGRIFDTKDTFSCKLLCYVRQCIQNDNYDSVIVVDNGKENALFELIPRILPVEREKVIRVVNYFEEPVIYPFDKIEKESNVAVIVDVVNTGLLLNKVLKLLSSYDVNISSVFAFISDVNISRDIIFSDIERSQDIKYYSFTEKKLANIKEIQQPFHEERFSLARKVFEGSGKKTSQIEKDNMRNFSKESFLSFWYSASKSCEIEIKYNNCDSSIFLEDGSEKLIESCWTHEIHLKNNASFSLEHDQQLSQFLKWLFISLEFTNVCITGRNKYAGLSKIIDKAWPSANIFNVEDLNSVKTNTKTAPHILVVYTTLNIGLTLKQTIRDIHKKFNGNTKVTCLTLFSRHNTIGNTQDIPKRCFEELEQDGIPIYCYYASSLPYYIFDPTSSSHKHIDTLLKQQIN